MAGRRRCGVGRQRAPLSVRRRVPVRGERRFPQGAAAYEHDAARYAATLERLDRVGSVESGRVDLGASASRGD